MSTTTWARHEKELPRYEIPAGRPDAENQLRSQTTVAEDTGMSPFALKMVALTLAFGVVFLATLGAWLWYSVHLYQNIG